MSNIQKYSRHFSYESLLWKYALTLVDGRTKVITIPVESYNENEPDYVERNIERIEADILDWWQMDKLRESIKADEKLHPEHPLVTKAKKEEAERRREAAKKMESSHSSSVDYSSSNGLNGALAFSSIGFLAAATGGCSTGGGC